jgi:HK97 family phage major capsid protein
MPELTQEQVNEGIKTLFEQNPDLFEKHAEDAAKEAAKDVPVNELKAQLTDKLQDEAEAEKTVDKVRGASAAFKDLSKKEQLQQMKSVLSGNGSTGEFQKSQSKWYFGDQKKNMERIAQGENKTSAPERVLGEYVKEYLDQGRKGVWRRVKDNLEQKGDDKGHRIVKDALTAGDLSAGGTFVPTELSEQIIEFNFANSVVRQFDVRVIDIENGSFEIPKFASKVSTRWEGEGTTGNSSRPDTEERTLDAKKLFVETPVSNDLLRRAIDGMQDQLLEHIRRALGNAEDIAFLRGGSGSAEPQGILNQIPSSQRFDREGSLGSAASAEDILQTVGKCKNLVDDSNLPTDSAGWVMTDRTVNGMMFQDVADGIYPQMIMQLMNGELINKPVRTTNQLLKNLDASGQGSDDETEIYYGVWDQLYIGDTLNMQVKVLENAAYNDGGTVKAGASRDETLIQGIHETDLAIGYDEAFAVAESVDFGADAFG